MGKIRSVVSALLILLSFSCWANMLQEKKTSFENLCELSVVDTHVLLSKADTLDVKKKKKTNNNTFLSD